MAHTLVCPNGHQTLVADVFAGRPALCSVCGSLVRPAGVAPPAESTSPRFSPQNSPLASSPTMAQTALTTPSAVAAEAKDEPADEITETATPRHGFEGVNRGLGFHYFKTAAQLLATILLAIFLGIVLYLQTRPPEWVLFIAGVAIIILVVALGALVLLAQALGIMGSILCLSVPAATKARPLILASFFCDVLLMVAAVVGWVLDQQGVMDWPPADPQTGIGPATRIANGLGSIGILGSWSFFLLFLWQLSRFFRDRIVAGEAFKLIGRLWAVVCGWVAVTLLFVGLAWLDAHRQQYDLSLIIGLGLFIVISVPLVLWASIWVLRSALDLIGSVRHIVQSRSE